MIQNSLNSFLTSTVYLFQCLYLVCSEQISIHNTSPLSHTNSIIIKKQENKKKNETHRTTKRKRETKTSANHNHSPFFLSPPANFSTLFAPTHNSIQPSILSAITAHYQHKTPTVRYQDTVFSAHLDFFFGLIPTWGAHPWAVSRYDWPEWLFFSLAQLVGPACP